MGIRIDAVKYEQFCKNACLQFGLSEETSEATARMLVRTDMLGIMTHGTVNLAPYLKKVAAGGIDAKAEPQVVCEGPTWAILDGHNAMGVYNGYKGLEIGIEKAKQYGMAYVGIKGSGHYGACGIYAITAAEQGMIALVMSNTVKNMAVPGGKGRIIGNSPIAYAVPAGEHRPVFMDIATSNVAGLKVINKKNAGEKVPEGWIVDADGKPTTDPSIPNWALVPIGGHKGYCLSFFVEVMCAVLTGGGIFASKSWMEMPQVANVSHCLLLLNVPAMADMASFEQGMGKAIREMTDSPKAEGCERVYLPGEIEWEKYEKAEKYGIEVNEVLLQNAREVATLTGLDFESCLIG